MMALTGHSAGRSTARPQFVPLATRTSLAWAQLPAFPLYAICDKCHRGGAVAASTIHCFVYPTDVRFSRVVLVACATPAGADRLAACRPRKAAGDVRASCRSLGTIHQRLPSIYVRFDDVLGSSYTEGR